MTAQSPALRNKSIFELLGIPTQDEQQESDLKEAELGTLKQFVLMLQQDPASAAIVTEVNSKLTALQSAQGEAYSTQLDALYSYLNEQFSGDLTDRLEAAVDQFKKDILTERINFLRERMQQHVDGYFAQAEELMRNEDVEKLLPYLTEIQEYLKNADNE